MPDQPPNPPHPEHKPAQAQPAQPQPPSQQGQPPYQYPPYPNQYPPQYPPQQYPPQYPPGPQQPPYNYNEQPYQQPYQPPYDPQYQQPPYQQPPYQQPYDPQYQQPYPPPYQQPYQQGTGQGLDLNNLNLDPPLAAGLAYLLFIFSGIGILIIEKKNEFVRFHAMQSILFTAAWLVVYFAWTILWLTLSMLSAIVGFAGPLRAIGLVVNLLFLGFFGVWIALMVRAYRGERWKLPVIGDIAERQLAASRRSDQG